MYVDDNWNKEDDELLAGPYRPTQPAERSQNANWTPTER